MEKACRPRTAHREIGKIGVAIAKKDSNRWYALIETGDGVPWNGKPTDTGTLWSSDDAGEHWQRASTDRQLVGRAAYYTRCAVSPDDPYELYFMSAAFSHSLDGGRTLTDLPSLPGGDNHDMWIDPANADRMAVANDSGISISVNHGRSWDRVQLPIAQLYHVTVDNQIPYFVYGNKQDGSSYRGPSNSLSSDGGGRGGGGGGNQGQIVRSVWHQVTGGESGFATPDPVDPNLIWSSASGSGSVGGIVSVFDERNGQARNVEVWPEQASDAPAIEMKYRFNWEFPLLISPHDHKKVYVGSQFVHLTTDGGDSWKVISPDLTLNDKSRQQVSGGLTGDNIGVEYAGVVFALAESPKQAGLIWAGTNDGLVQLTRDGGKNWTNVTANIPGLPPTAGGFWILDDLTAIEQMTPDILSSNAHLFPPRDAYRFRTVVQPEALRDDPTAGQNGPYGASIHYYLKSAPSSDVKLAILDASGRTVRTLTGTKLTGLNRIYWDLRFNPTKEIRLRTPPEYAPEIANGPEGWRPALGIQRISAFAPPGSYTIKMTADGKDFSQPLKVVKDPHSNSTEGDINIQTKLLSALSDDMNGVVDAVNRIESIRAQLAVLEAEVGKDQNGAALRTAAEQLNTKLLEVEDHLLKLKSAGRGQDGVRWSNQLVEKIAYLAGEVEGSDDHPTTQQVAVHDELREQAATYKQRLALLLGKEVADFNALLRQKNVPNILTTAGAN